MRLVTDGMYPVIIYGPTGSGKKSILDHFAKYSVKDPAILTMLMKGG